jgi:integrase
MLENQNPRSDPLFNAEPLFLTTDTGQKIRILTPHEHDAILRVIQMDHSRTLFNIAFFTGMRYIEIERLHEHPEWVFKDRKIIHLDREAQRKVRRSTPERNVPIAPQIQGELPYFFRNKKPPSIQVWNRNLKRWAKNAGISEDGEGIVPKMCRASIETWMYLAGIPAEQICLRQGHDKLTSLNHYQAFTGAFTIAEKEEIKTRLAGWH